MAMAMLLRRIGVEVTVHGFRSSFRDWCAECTGYAHEVAEMALAHTIDNKVERAYRRGDLFEKRRRLMDDWAAYCVTGEVTIGDNVTPIRGVA
jgi:integrase